MTLMELVETLFRHGLGELPVFHKRLTGAYLGNMVYEKGYLLFKDRGILGDAGPEPEELTWEQRPLGMVCFKTLLKWQSLTFYGVDYCTPADLDPDLRSSLVEARDQFGERLFDFVGSIYRAYHLLLDHGFLPVVLLRQVTSRNGDDGLAIADLHSLALPEAVLQRAADNIRGAVARQTVLKVGDFETPESRT